MLAEIASLPPVPAGLTTRSADVEAAAAVNHYLQPLKAILAGDITEVVVNGPGAVWTEGRVGWQEHLMPELTYEHLRLLVKLIANSTNQKISEENPLVSAVLPGGERVQVVVPPAVSAGTVSLTIRKPSQLRFTLDDYERSGAFDRVAVGHDPNMALESELKSLLDTRRIAPFLKLGVESKQNIVISGPTGSGKTTLMKTLVDLIPSPERLITIEDAAELSIIHQRNFVRLFYSKDGQGVAKVTPKMLLEATLRMKPDRVLLAELRSDEAFYFIRNINSGHPGSMTSVHAASPRLAIEQLMLLVKESPAGSNLSREDIKDLLFMMVDVVVQFATIDGAKRVTGIYYEPERKRTLLG
jgi:type IV secretion system protein VirB11